MSKPKIAVLAFLRGGIGHYVAQLSPYLEKDFNFEYIYYKYGLAGDEVQLDDQVIMERIKKKPITAIEYEPHKNCVASLAETIRLLKEKKINILNIHISVIAQETAFYHISLINAVKRMGIKILYIIHDVEPFEPYIGGDELLKTIYSLADGATVGNSNELKKLINKYKFNKNKVEIAPHGVYTMLNRNKYSKEEAKKYLGIPLNKKVVLNFGWLRPYKGIDNLIAAMPAVLEKNNNAYLYLSLTRRVFDNSKILDNQILGQVNSLNLQNNSKITFDFVPSTEIEPIFKSADVVVLPYTKVSQSGILNLALAFQKAVVFSDLFVETKKINGKMGIAVSPGKADLLAEAISGIINDDNLRERYEKNISEFLKNDPWEETADKVRILAKKMLKKK